MPRQAVPVGTIAFASDRAGLGDIYLMSGRGTNQRRLTPKDPLHSDDDPVWSPAGDRLAFVRQLAGFDRDESEVSALHIINAVGTGLRRLVETEGDDYLGKPVWSPDGLTIAYDTLSIAGQSSGVAINVADVTTGIVTSLTAEGGREDSPAWSPDGRLLAFTSRPKQGATEIWVMRPDGTDRRPIVAGKGLANPTWSPDGRRISFGSGKADFTGWFALDVVDVDGSNRRRLASRVAYNGAHAWSPNGRQLVYGGGAGAGRGVYEVFAIRADGSGKRRLTHNSALEVGLTWSPDGSWIAFSSRRHDNTDIYLAAADGSGERRLTTSRSSDSSPAWRPTR